MSEKEYDIILYGASGFTGRQTALYFAKSADASKLRWAIGGRNEAKLEEVRSLLGPVGENVPILVADSSNQKEVDALVAQTRVLLTTVGPYAKYGTPIVDACVRLGVDYVDITGEAPWVRDLIDRYHEEASQKSVRIVPFCGFDSVPSDIGTMLVVDQVHGAGLDCKQVKSFYSVFGGINGGTLGTMLTLANEETKSALDDPLLLMPDRFRNDAERKRARDVNEPVHDGDLEQWVAPFFMAPVNTRVVRRSRGLAAEYGNDYGQNFDYREYWKMPPGVSYFAAMGVSRGIEMMTGLARWKPARELIQSFAPKPGEGPPEFFMDLGFFRAEFIGIASNGDRFYQTVSDKGDPNNRATVKTLCESALTLALNRDSLPGGESRGGVLTPALGLGLPLVRRLEAAGMTFHEDRF